MTLKHFAITTAIFSLAVAACNSPEDIAGCDLSTDDYELVWSDEFEGETIDESKWSFDIGDGCDRGICGWGNRELQYYTDDPDNAYVSNGNLIIRALKKPTMDYAYSSARMVTKNKGDWKFGRIDARARLPIGQGLWPAIWMLPTDNVYGGWPTSGEIDIMELIGSEPSTVLGTIHWGHDTRRFQSSYYDLETGTFDQDFHVFSTIWTEDCIQFLVDDIPYGEVNTRSTTQPSTWPFDQDFHLIMNIAVGGNLPGDPSPTLSFPRVMQVDYVRVYQKKNQ